MYGLNSFLKLYSLSINTMIKRLYTSFVDSCDLNYVNDSGDDWFVCEWSVNLNASVWIKSQLYYFIKLAFKLL